MTLAVTPTLGCYAVRGVATGKFEKQHPDCDDTTTLRDFDGTVHVLGCGTVETYHCVTTIVGGPSYRYERAFEATTGEILYNFAGMPITPGSSPDTTAYRRTATFATQTTCEANDKGYAVTGTEAWREPPPLKEAPPIVVLTEHGHTQLKVDLVLNRRALLSLTAAPSEYPDRVAFRVAWHEPNESQQQCPVSFLVDEQPFATPVPSIKISEHDMVSQRLNIEGQQLDSFDRIKKLTVVACNRRWFLKREHIIRLRELMARFRQEAARTTPAAPSVAPEATPEAAPTR